MLSCLEGRQTALKLAEKLDRYGIKVIGTSYDSLDLAEDRGRFTNLLKELEIPYPKFSTVTTADEAGFGQGTRVSVVGASFLRVGRAEDENRHQQRRAESHVIDLFHTFPGNRVLSDHFWSVPSRPKPMPSATAKTFWWWASWNTWSRRHPLGRQLCAVAFVYVGRLGDYANTRVHRAHCQGVERERTHQRTVCDQTRQGVCDRGQPAGLAYGTVYRQGVQAALRKLGHESNRRARPR